MPIECCFCIDRIAGVAEAYYVKLESRPDILLERVQMVGRRKDTLRKTGSDFVSEN